MTDNSHRDERALIGHSEYQFIEKVDSVCVGETIVVCADSGGGRRYATLREWEMGRERFSSCRDVSTEVSGFVTAASSAEEKLALFRSLFVAHADVYAKSYFNRKSSHIGYTPACTNEWKRGVCGKTRRPPIKCADCENRSFLPLDDATLIRHFQGDFREGFGVVAVYPLTEGSRTRFLAADFDGADWKAAASAFWDACDKAEVPAAVERSRSGNGAHVWGFVDEARKHGFRRQGIRSV